jgi:hypothetical protein
MVGLGKVAAGVRVTRLRVGVGGSVGRKVGEGLKVAAMPGGVGVTVAINLTGAFVRVVVAAGC